MPGTRYHYVLYDKGRFVININNKTFLTLPDIGVHGIHYDIQAVIAPRTSISVDWFLVLELLGVPLLSLFECCVHSKTAAAVPHTEHILPV